MARPVRALIVAPHPDDEVLGCTSVLSTRACVVAHVTTGVPARADEAVEPTAEVPPLADQAVEATAEVPPLAAQAVEAPPLADQAVEATAEVRMQEALSAARVLGADIERRLQLGFEDQAAWRGVVALAAAIAAAVEAAGPDEVYVPAYQNGHPDHDATYVAGQLARRQATRPARWRVYSLYGVDRHGQHAFDHLDAALFPAARRMPLSSAQRNAKTRALQCFTTQVRPSSVLQRWLTAPAGECFAPLPARAGPLPVLPCYYETAFPDRCAVPAATVRAELARHT